MKKCNFYLLLGLNVALLSVVLLIMYFVLPKLDVFRVQVVIYTILLALANTLLIRGLVLKIDSSLFCAVLLFSICTIGFVAVFGDLSYAQLWHYYILGLALANFSIRIAFFDRLQGFLGIISSGFFIFSLLFSLSFYGIMWYIILDIIWALTCFVICSKIIRN